MARVVGMFPNSYKELPTRADYGKAAFEDDVGEHFEKLDRAGKFSTFVRYLVAVIALVALMVSEILRDSNVVYTVASPTYEEYVALKSNAANRNLVCRTKNAALKYGDFISTTFESHESCDWVAKDVLKDEHHGLGFTVENLPGYYYALDGNISACKSTEMSPSRMHTCLALKEGCEKGAASLNRALNQLEATLMPTTTLLEDNTLNAIVGVVLNSTVDGVLQATRQSSDIVKQWASHNMPRLYAYMRIHRARIQALSYRAGNDFELVNEVNGKCVDYQIGSSTHSCDKTKIGDGSCDYACNRPACLYDGGDCEGQDSFQITEPQVAKYGGINGYAPLSWSGTYTKGSQYTGAALQHNFMSQTDADMYTFDNATCGDNSTWANTVEVDYDAEGIIQDVYRVNTSAMSEFLKTYGYSITPPTLPSRWPSTQVPVFDKKTFSCDSWVRALHAISYTNMSSTEIASWVQYYKDLGAAAKTMISACSDYSQCPSFTGFDRLNLRPYTIGAVDANWAWLSATVNENSGSVMNLILDAGLKRNSSGYAVSAPVSYKQYYTAAQVDECTYTRSVRTSSAALLSIVFGLIGGIFTLSNSIGLFMYSVIRKRVLSTPKA
ncbi:Notch domain [Ostreococcus tauri]|uniref:Notch domain n=1 Tax=Ostreococcus tauri TaxID=70448 RepID=A0A096P9J0_OSTTA|nr:Notch domain [Ostreococcus tauri]CEG01259.1 Notch domain [Ostreococcus tauri]|eukprot:XP_003080069.1 Notch domain [Ostreococcus tauri]